MAQATSAWTLADLDRLPDDGNKYEVIDGELFVTPAPSPVHEELATTLRMILEPYVTAENLGHVYTASSVIQTQKSKVEPDLMVRKTLRPIPENWPAMPTPILVVEVLSRITHRRDQIEKRAFYLRSGIGQYWIVNRWDRTIQIITANADHVTADTRFTWHPPDASNAIVVDVTGFFTSVLG